MSDSPPDWRTVIFTDEKRWNLDGPDSASPVWRHPEAIRPTAFRRVARGGSVMVWGGISASGTTHLIPVPTTLDHTEYIDILKKYMGPEGLRLGGENWKLLQDNSSVHRAKGVVKMLETDNYRVIWLPTNSPDLNPIENLWGLLTRDVFKGGRQFCDKRSLMETVQKAWHQIQGAHLVSLADSMPKRCAAVIEARGGDTKY